MQKWEYLNIRTEYHANGFYYTATSKGVVIFKDEDKAQIQDINSYLDNLGGEGWEMLSVNIASDLPITTYYFKRLRE